jgi:hypothetical protein
VPGTLARGHDFSRAEQRGHVQVVPAGVHHRNVMAGVVLNMNFTGIGESGFFFNGQGVKFGTQHDGRSRSIFQNGHHACAAEVFGYFVTCCAQVGSQFVRGLCLVL